MPRLILLNGPPGIGKSTIAELYVDDHPGTLNLDIDQVRFLVGGWRDNFEGAGELARPLAVAIARTHLRAGYDVFMPQYLGRLSEIERFETVAGSSGAEFREIVLMDTKERSLDRFSVRGDDAQRPWHRQVQEIVYRSGGVRHLEKMHDQLIEVMQSRPTAIVVQSDVGEIRRMYNHVLEALEDAQSATAPDRQKKPEAR